MDWCQSGAAACWPLLFENDDPDFQYTKRGSCTLLTFRPDYFAVFAEHQRQGYSPEAIRIIHGFTGGPALAADTFVVVNPTGEEEEIEDLRALRISPSHHHREQLSDFYFICEQQLPPVQSARMLIAIGTPTQASEIDYQPAHIHVGTVPVSCLYERRTSATGVHTVMINPSHTEFFRLELDGMSGGSIYSIDGNPGKYVANFRGIILRGKNGYLHYMDIALIRSMFEKMKAPTLAPSPDAKP